MTGVSPIDSKLDRQGFIIVYNPLEKESYTAAQQLITDLVEKMAKPEDENEAEKEDAGEVAPFPLASLSFAP